MTKILVVGSTHGHERIGLAVIEELKKLPIEAGSIEYVVGNPVASQKGVPFIESDLNRVFPGQEQGTYEEMRAYALSPKIQAADIVIDIHSTKTTDLSDQSMVIVTSLNQETAAILGMIRPPKVLHMMYKSGNALISGARIGIAFEYGKDDSELVLQAMLYDIALILCHEGLLEKNPYPAIRAEGPSDTYDVYDAFKKDFTGGYVLDAQIANFELVTAGSVVCTTERGESITAPEDFYPILFGNNRYTEILGFRGRKKG